MRLRYRPIAFVLLAVVMVACGTENPPSSGANSPAGADRDLNVLLASVTSRAEPQIADGRDVDAVGGATAAFALDLYRQAADTDGNLVLGPYSAWMALAMTTAGADGATRDELTSALHFPFEEDRVLPAINALDRLLTNRATDDAAHFNVANRLWGQQGLPFRASFLDDMVEHFGAPLVAADFRSDPERARVDINGWVGKRTAGKIPELFPADAIDANTALALVNAVHLDAPWEFAFDPEDTKRMPFTRPDGSAVDVEMMHFDEYLATDIHDEWLTVELPYRGSGLSMVVVVPNDFPAFEAALDTARLDEVFGGLEEGGVHLALPLFSFKTHSPLIEPLRRLGVSSAFGSGADFGRMTDGGGLFVSAVEHEAFIKVDEEGTEAAAATGVGMALSHGPTIEANRPFMFFIRDRATNAIVFIGRVLDPTAAS